MGGGSGGGGRLAGPGAGSSAAAAAAPGPGPVAEPVEASEKLMNKIKGLVNEFVSEKDKKEALLVGGVVFWLVGWLVE